MLRQSGTTLILCLMLAFCGAAPCGEGDPVSIQDLPKLIEFGAKDGTSRLPPFLGPYPDDLHTEEGFCLGPILLAVERVEARGHRVELRLRNLPGGGPFVDRAILLGGASGPEDGRVHLDSRDSALASLNFRGLLTPVRLVAERLPQEDGDATRLRFRLTMEEIGSFQGLLSRNGFKRRSSLERPAAGEGQWMPMTGRAERLDATLIFDLRAGKLYDPRLESMTLLGKEAGGGDVAFTVFDLATVWSWKGASSMVAAFAEDGRFRGISAVSGRCVADSRQRATGDPALVGRAAPEAPASVTAPDATPQ